MPFDQNQPQTTQIENDHICMQNRWAPLLKYANELRQSRLLESKKARARQWTPEKRAAQALKIRKLRPWERSTGPKTHAGKQAVRLNAFISGHYCREVKELDALLRKQRRMLPILKKRGMLEIQRFQYQQRQERLTMSLKMHYRDAKDNLKEVGVDTPDLDARLLLQNVMEMSDTQFVSEDYPMSQDQKRTYSNYIFRRMNGEPVSKILGYKEFYGRTFKVTKDTLDPRPDTETLIESALQWAKAQNKPLRILDMGTGTGCIAITLASELPNAQLVATDVSKNALDIARQNAENQNVTDRVTFIESDWFESVDGTFDLIVSNPPYIPNPDIESLAKEVRNHDPILALDGGQDGLDPYKIIFSKIKNYLNLPGKAFFEFGFSQADDIVRLAESHGFGMVGITPDIAQIPRVVEISVGENNEK